MSGLELAGALAAPDGPAADPDADPEADPDAADPDAADPDAADPDAADPGADPDADELGWVGELVASWVQAAMITRSLAGSARTDSAEVDEIVRPGQPGRGGRLDPLHREVSSPRRPRSRPGQARRAATPLDLARYPGRSVDRRARGGRAGTRPVSGSTPTRLDPSVM